MLNCHDATRLMSERQERKLKIIEQISLKFHVSMCAGCQNFNQQMFMLHKMASHYVKHPQDDLDKPSPSD